MDVVILLVFISLALVAAGLIFFFYRLREGDFEHGERLALTPLADDEIRGTEPSVDETTEASHVSKGLEGGISNVES